MIKGLDELFGAGAGLQAPTPAPEPSGHQQSDMTDDDQTPEPTGFSSAFDREWGRAAKRGSTSRNNPERGEAAALYRRRTRTLRERPPDDDEDMEDPNLMDLEDNETSRRDVGRDPGAAYMPKAKTVDHCTPAVISEALALVWPREADGRPGTDLDPCASSSGLQVVRAKVELRGPDVGEDGLTYDWCIAAPPELDRCARVYSNCPYGKAHLIAWVAKMVTESVGTGGGASVIGLLPSRTSSAWFHDLVLEHAAAVCYVRSRLRFVGAEDAAPFGSILPLWSEDAEEIERFRYAFGEAKIAKIRKGFRPIGRVQVLR